MGFSEYMDKHIQRKAELAADAVIAEAHRSIHAVLEQNGMDQEARAWLSAGGIRAMRPQIIEKQKARILAGIADSLT